MLQSLCRLCLSDADLVDVYDNKFTHAEKLRQMILKATDIQIQMDDSTRTVCQQCCNLVLSMHKFRNQAKASDIALQRYAADVNKATWENAIDQINQRPNIVLDLDLELRTLSRSSSESNIVDTLDLRLTPEEDLVESGEIIDDECIVNFDDTERPDFYEMDTAEREYISGLFAKYKDVTDDDLPCTLENREAFAGKITFPNPTTTVIHNAASDLGRHRIPVVTHVEDERDVRFVDAKSFKRKLPMWDWSRCKVQKLANSSNDESVIDDEIQTRKLLKRQYNNK